MSGLRGRIRAALCRFPECRGHEAAIDRVEAAIQEKTRGASAPERKVWRAHTHRSSFYWDSRLGNERKDELIAWVASLSEEDARNLGDLIEDSREDAREQGHDEAEDGEGGP